MHSSGNLQVDDVHPPLTSRFLAFRDPNQEEKEDSYWITLEEPCAVSAPTVPKPATVVRSSSNNCNSNGSGGGSPHKDEIAWLWSSNPSMGCPPLEGGCCHDNESINLFALFSSSPTSEQSRLWHYGNVSPVTASKPTSCSTPAAVAAATAAAVSPATRTAAGTAPEPMLWMPDPRRSLEPTLRDEEDRPPTLIRCRRMSVCSSITVGSRSTEGKNKNRNGSGISYELSNGAHVCVEDEDDEVSLLADDPDEDDDEVLPHATYDVLANLFDDI